MVEQMQLPIAEVFDSIQGEGYWTGHPMRFIRLAGCPVGKKANEEYDEKEIGTFPIVISKCKTWDGRFFDCDTDFSCHTYMTVSELLDSCWQKHICLTGGEPLIHQHQLIKLGFFKDAFEKGKMIHIETSGTIEIHRNFDEDSRLWITCAPKWQYLDNMVRRADEVKILVDENLIKSKIPDVVRNHKRVYLSPINGEKEINQENVKLAYELLQYISGSALSCQWHKFLNMR